MNYDDLSPELKERVRACKSTEELLSLAQDEGLELSDEELQAVSGGFSWCARDGSGCQCLCDVHSR